MKYDRDLKDIFVLQDDITIRILTALEVKLTEVEQARLWGKGTANKVLTLNHPSVDIHALLCCIHLLNRQHEKAIAEREEAIAFAPNNAG